jgi:hypothetical protein
MTVATKRAAGTGSSVVLDACQICDHQPLEQVLFLGYLPPVNQMRPIGQLPHEQPAYPAMFLKCPRCKLVQLGLAVDPNILFPPEYPYTSGTTRILRDNFAELYADCRKVLKLTPDDLVVDIGSNDGTLLGNFRDGGHRVHGIEPTDMGKLATQRGIPTTIAFFDQQSADAVRLRHGTAKIITATNVFAHIENVHQVAASLLTLLDDRGVFISESHYLMSLIETLQYDTIYHEHLRYYSLTSLQYLLKMHGLEVIRAKRIPTHGGSIRVYAARTGVYRSDGTGEQILAEEASADAGGKALADFKARVVQSKLRLHALLADIRIKCHRVYGIGAPSRASTLINYAGLDDGILDCVLEVTGSHKVGKYMPGTVIPVEEEGRLFRDQPEYAMLLSWHIAEELMPKLRQKGYRGKFIIPLPNPRIVQ